MKAQGSVSKQTPAPKPAAAAGSGGKVIGPKPIRAISGPSIKCKPVGPKNAPYIDGNSG